MSRVRYATLALIAIGGGLALRAGGPSLSPTVADISGDALWAAMVFWWISAAWPRGRPVSRAAIALSAAYLTEFSQLVRAPWLARIRATTLGHLVLGSDFDWRDFASYALGIAAALLLDRAIASRSRDPAPR